MNISISCAGTTYDEFTGRRLDENRVRADLSDNLHIIFNSRGPDMDVSVTINSGGSVHQFARDLSFYLGCLEDQEIWINGVGNRFNITHDAAEMREQRESVERIIETLEFANVDTKLVLVDDLTAEAQRDLESLRRGLLEGEAIDPAAPTSGRTLLRIGCWQLELLVELTEDSGKWILHNPFDPSFSRHYYVSDPESDDDLPTHHVTPYDVLDVEDIKHTLNLNLGYLVQIYEKLPDTPARLEFANGFLLRLLLAADDSPLRRDEFTAAAEDLSNWILEDGEALDPIHQINAWQIKARRGNLVESDVRQIREVRRLSAKKNDSTAREIEFCCSILLGDSGEALDRLAALSEAERLKVESWPIFLLLDAAG